MPERSTADSRFTTTECLDPGDWRCYREKASSSFLTLVSAQMQPPATPSEDWNPFIPISGRRHSAGWEQMLKRQRGTVTAFQVARPVLLRFAFTFFHQGVLGTGSRARLRSGLGLAQTHSTTEEVRTPQHLSARESAHLLPQNNTSQEGQ